MKTRSISPFQLARELEAELGSRFFLSPRPDHPHIYSPPDLLLGGNGTLVALFFPKSRETSEALLARLAASRLALPKHTRCVLFTSIHHLLDALANDFHEIFLPGEISNLVGFIRDTEAVGRIKPVPEEIRKKVRARYQRLFEFTRSVLKQRVVGGEPSSLFAEMRVRYQEPVWPSIRSEQDLKTTGRRKSPHIRLLKVREDLVGFPEFLPHRHSTTNLLHYCSYSFSNDFRLDNGIPYPVSLRPGILAVNRAPEGKLDPYKPLRVAAFAGWIISMFDSPYDLENMLERSSSIMDNSIP